MLARVSMDASIILAYPQAALTIKLVKIMSRSDQTENRFISGFSGSPSDPSVADFFEGSEYWRPKDVGTTNTTMARRIPMRTDCNMLINKNIQTFSEQE
jgi:hypothetical protein